MDHTQRCPRSLPTNQLDGLSRVVPCWMIIQHEHVGCFPRCRGWPAASGDQAMPLPSILLFVFPSPPVPLLQRRTQTTPHARFLNSVPRQCILLQHRKREMPEATNCCIHILSRQINHPLSPKRFILTVLYIIGPVGIFWRPIKAPR
jgi:hypothetical protein